MIKNYFKIAFRNIKRYSTHSILNISGMAIGIACAILILLWVQDEWSYDRHLKNAKDLYRVLETQYYAGGKSIQEALTPSPLAATLKKEYPEIINSSRYRSLPIPLPNGDEFILEDLASVDKDFLKIFNIRFVRGDMQSALNGPHDLVITEEMAEKYFGKEDPLGKTLTVMKSFVFTVTGVIKSLPHNSHIQINFLVPFEFLGDLGANINDWGNIQCFTYIQLLKGTDRKIIDNKIRNFLREDDKRKDTEIFLQNIKKIHLFSSGKYAGDISGHGDITYVRILSLIAVFILIIACINFMNLTTAQSVRRAKEIGLRKVAGATRIKIVVQFLGESLLIAFAAYIIAMILVELLLPGFRNLIGNHLAINYQSAGLYLGLITIVLFCGLIAGSYPALYLSSLKPLNVIKGIINKNPGNTQFRRVLVIFQFSLSVLLIICTIIVGNQLKYLQTRKLGLNIDNVAYFQFSLGIQRETLKKDLSNNPDIVSVTIAEQNTFSIMDSESDFDWEGKKEGDDALFSLRQVDEDYARTLQLQLKEGRFFSHEFSTDNTAIVINEKAAEVVGFRYPVGEILRNSQGLKLKIIGVVKDFHFKSLHNRIEPLIMYMRPPGGNACFIRMKPDKITSTIEYIKKTFKSYNLPYSIDLKFLDDEYDQLYRTEQKTGKIFKYFSLLAIIISCLGLLGLSLFMTELRTKEAGLRKVHGAKSFEIFLLLSKEYVIWVSISIIIACPIGWYVMDKWLQNFAYRINIFWWVFAIAGGIALLIALLTVSYQSYRAANKNPVDALRYE
jgi:putative ABC transport system permease protein